MIGKLFVVLLLALVAMVIVRSLPDIRRYLEISPSSPYETGKIWSKALREAGVPE